MTAPGIWLYYERDGALGVDRTLVDECACLTQAAELYKRERVRRMQLGEWHWRRSPQPAMQRRPAPGAQLAMVIGILALDDGIPPPPKRRT